MKYPLHHIGIIRGFDNKSKKKHYGVDFGWHGDPHAPVYAIADGEVIYIKYQLTGGYTIRIKHYKTKKGYVYSEYGHLQKKSIKVKVGDKVKMYQKIANMGNTGMASGCHLHLTMYFDKYANKNKVNPLDYLCLYNDQEVNKTTKDNYRIYKTKKVSGCKELNIRNKPNTKGKVVRTAKKGEQVESYGKEKGWNIVDNLRNYYCSNNYLK